MINSVVELLNNQIQDIRFRFSESKFNSQLKINNFPAVFFDNYAGGNVGGGSYNWLQKKHENRTLHEPATIATLLYIQKYYSREVDIIFDIGALYGYFSLISKSIFPKSIVFSFEMNPESHIALHKNINSNKHLGIPATQCLNLGLSDKTNLQKRVHARGFILREDKEYEYSSVIDLISVDDFCRISGFQPNLIKIDVEGYQAKIIPGSMDTIEKAKPIIILEFDSPKKLEYFNTTNKQITQPLFDLKYQCYWCKNHRGFSEKFQQLDYNSFSREHEQNSLSVFIPN